MTRAQEIRETADRDAIAAVMASFPAAEEVPPLAVSRATAELEKLSDDPERRAEQLAERMESCAGTLQEDVERYECLRSQGLDALTDYDLAIAYGGDPIAAIAGALRLKTVHVARGRGVLLMLLLEQAETTVAIEAARPQLALF